MEERARHIRRVLARTQPRLARIEHDLAQREAELARRRQALQRLQAEVAAVELRLDQLQAASDAGGEPTVDLLRDAVERAWADVERDLRRLSGPLPTRAGRPRERR
jgi:hypothetical protein